MAPNISNLASKNLETSFWAKYALTPRKYALTPRKYALIARKYALTSRKELILKNIVTRFVNNFRIYGTPPSPGVYNDTDPCAMKPIWWGNFLDLVRLPTTLHNFPRLPKGPSRTRNTICGNFLWESQGKKKHININKFAGLSRDWVGAKILFMCFFRVIPYGGEKTHKQNSPQNPGTIPWKFCLRVFSLCVFFAL